MTSVSRYTHTQPSATIPHSESPCQNVSIDARLSLCNTARARVPQQMTPLLSSSGAPSTINIHTSVFEEHFFVEFKTISKSARMLTASAKNTSSLHLRLTLRDVLRLVLFLVTPIYARSCIPSSISAKLRHIYIIGSTGVCIVHFSGGRVGLDLVGDAVYGLAMSTFPSWSKSIPLIAWMVPTIEGWHGTVINWMFIAMRLTTLLPEEYGEDVEMRRLESVIC
jgi:hypothetical protein